MEWISVKDKLPVRETQKVIVHITRFNYGPWYFDVSQYKDGKWTGLSGHEAVTHWMPFPEPPD